MPLSERFFGVEDSLLLVAIVVIGGLGSIAGPILGALWVIGLPAFFPGNDLVPLLTSSVGLLVLLLYFPGGFVQIGYRRAQLRCSTGWRVGCRPSRAGQPRPPVAAVRRPRPSRPHARGR